MKTFNRKPLFLALAGITALGAAGAAQAVAVSANGLGDAMINPYYTVKGTVGTNAYNTLISVVNTTGSTKAVKIRFREGKASAEVLDFNIFLSPYDVWTAALKQSATGGVVLRTSDKTCTIPKVVDGAEFRNNQYVGDEADDNSLERLREGYFEVIEMATYTDGSVIAVNSKHKAGVPVDCSKVTNATADKESQLTQGGLSGTASLVAPGTGLNAAVDPTPIVGCYVDNYYFSNSDKPTFADCTTFSNTSTYDGNIIHADWNNGQDATSAALMKFSIINEFVLDTATNSATDWVVTFPTKHHYVDNYSTSTPGKLFESPLTPDGSCDTILLYTWDREELPFTPASDDFSPPLKNPDLQICWEANVVTFNNKNLFNSSQTLGVTTAFQNGWARMDFVPKNTTALVANASYGVFLGDTGAPSTGSANTTFSGLPVIGFAVQTFRPVGTSSYAGVFPHRFDPGTPDIFFAQ